MAGRLIRTQNGGGWSRVTTRTTAGATLALRDWLEALRPQLAARLGLSVAELPRPVVAEPERDPRIRRVTRLRSAWLSSVPAQPSERTPEQAAVALLADLLEWHRRENKPAWWRYIYVRTLSSSDLVNEPDALGLLSDGEIVGSVKKSVLRRFSFPLRSISSARCPRPRIRSQAGGPLGTLLRQITPYALLIDPTPSLTREPINSTRRLSTNSTEPHFQCQCSLTGAYTSCY
jgi:hypothetical protein